ncbi:MAG: hypothetical protein IH874_04275 [Candidatus Dadabacteria bacterium]|nr:hypothetical protein [Candidatus Dadabacteria bacterium]
MRCLLKAEIPVEEGNAGIKDGSLPKTFNSIIEELKPEAAYFLAQNGKRAAFFFIDMQDPSQLPAVAEPLFLAFNASVEIIPVMKPEDLMKAAPAIKKAVNKYG